MEADPLPMLSIEMDMELYASDAFPNTTIPDIASGAHFTMEQYRALLVKSLDTPNVAPLRVPTLKRPRSTEGNGSNKVMK